MPPSSTKISKPWMLASALVSCLLSSCAVLTVDVDVYKGPLTNENRVQMQQLIALAEGAQPLLTHLRDTLEWSDDGKIPEEILNYGPGYIEGLRDKEMRVKRCSFRQTYFTSCKEGAIGFQNPLAHRVNDVLGWYEDIPNANGSSERLIKGGLRTEIANYRMTKGHQPSTEARSPQEQQQQEDLIKSLVGFAAKILFLANHEDLSSPPETRGLISGGLGNLSRGLFGDTLTENFSPMVYWDNFIGKGTLAENKRRQYVRLLQAVGNSILLSANELRERQEFHKEDRNRADVELSALKETLVKDPNLVYVKLVQELTAEQQQQNTLIDSLAAEIFDLTNKMKETNSNQPVSDTQVDTKLWEAQLETLKITDSNLQAPLKVAEDEKLSKAITALKDTPKDTTEVWTTIEKQITDSMLDGKTKEEAKIYFTNNKDDFRLNQKFFSQPPAKSGFADIWKDITVQLRDKQKEVIDDLQKHQALINLFGQTSEKKKSKQSAVDRIAKLTPAINEIVAAKTSVLLSLEKQNKFVSGRVVYHTLAKHLESEKETRKAETEKVKTLNTALEVLNERVPPADFTIPTGQTYADARAVLDHEIALLRQEHIQAVRAEGHDANSIAIRKALAALEAAAQHRAGLVYLRPAAAYLRTSYPSTSLQDDPNLSWDNLLLQQGMRDIPFSSYLADIVHPAVRQDRVIAAELDKQYWQNINRVRVSGAGTTNYVLAKDDVGNWYVKHYFGDTERIFESARNLGLYNLGAAMRTNLLSSLKTATTEGKSSTIEAKPAPLQRVFNQHRDAYTKKAETDFTALKEMVEKDLIPTSIKETWRASQELKDDEQTLERLDVQLTVSVKRLKNQFEELDTKTDASKGVRVVRQIKAIRDFHNSLKAAIGKLDLTKHLAENDRLLSAKVKTAQEAVQSSPTQDNKDILAAAERELATEQTRQKQIKPQASKAVSDVVKDKLSDFVETRQHVLRDYEQAILFVGEASKN